MISRKRLNRRRKSLKGGGKRWTLFKKRMLLWYLKKRAHKGDERRIGELSNEIRLLNDDKIKLLPPKNPEQTPIHALVKRALQQPNAIQNEIHKNTRSSKKSSSNFTVSSRSRSL
jgi:hypothetical protein